MLKHTTIYLDPEEEITSVIERIKKTPSSDIALVVPLKSIFSFGVINLKILKNQADKIGKNVLLITRDPLCLSLAKQVGLNAEKKLDQDLLKRTTIDTITPRANTPIQIKKRKGNYKKSKNVKSKILSNRLSKKAFDFSNVQTNETQNQKGFSVQKKSEMLNTQQNGQNILDINNSSINKPSETPKSFSFSRISRFFSPKKKVSIDGARPSTIKMPSFNYSNTDINKLKEIFSQLENKKDISKVGLSQEENNDKQNNSNLVSPKILQKNTPKSILFKPEVDQKEVKISWKDLFFNFFKKAEKEASSIVVSKNKSDRILQKNGQPFIAPKTKIDTTKEMKKNNKDYKIINQNSLTNTDNKKPSFFINQKDKQNQKPSLMFQRDVGVASNFKPPLFSKEAVKRVTLLPGGLVKWLLLFVALLLVIIILTMVFTVSRSEIKITKKKNIIEKSIFVKGFLDKELEVEEKTIPIQELEKEILLEKEFDASGVNENKGYTDRVSGDITIYNEFSSSFEILVAQTRFKSKDGLIFKTVEGVKIPGFKKEAGKIIPGKITVEVVADKSGEEFALQEGRLNIPGLQGDARYQKIYGQIESPLMKPGETKQQKFISKEDLKKAEEIFSDELKKKFQEEYLKDETSLKIIEDSVVINDLVWEEKIQVGKETEHFNLKGRALVKGSFFDEKDLLKIGDKLLKEDLKEGEELVNPLFIENAEELFNKETKEVKMEIKFKGFTVFRLNEEDIKKEVMGLANKEAEEKLESLSFIEEASIESHPFWVKNIPNGSERIKVIVFD